jgi:hypothetical protein
MRQHNHATRHRWTLGVALMAGVTSACALFDPPSDEVPPYGGLPPGVTAGPATTQVGPVTTPTPAMPDQTPSPTREPLGNFAGERGPRVAMDTATRTASARLDSVIVHANRNITSMPIPLARGLLRSISASLEGSRVPRVRAVATELDSLHTLLGATPFDDHAVGHSMLRLSARANAAAPEAGVLAGRVARLADALKEAGTPLARQRQ